MDRFLLRRLARGRAMSPDIAWALRTLQASRGGSSIGALSRALSCSRKTLIKRFQAQIGLSPKAVAGILRFEHATGRLRAGSDESWSELALACGYSDQAHFNRDFRRYSGRTPTEYRRPCCRTAAASRGKIRPRPPRPAGNVPASPTRTAGARRWLTKIPPTTPTFFQPFASRMLLPRSTGSSRAFGFEKQLRSSRVRRKASPMLSFGLAPASSTPGIGSRPAEPGNPWTTEPYGIYAVVKDIDAHYKRAKAAGARIERPLSDTDYGAREYSVRDCEGHLWSFGTYDPYADQ